MKPFWRVLCRRLRARGILIPLFILRVSDFNHTLYLLDEFFHQVFLELYFNRKVRNVSNGSISDTNKDSMFIFCAGVPRQFGREYLAHFLRQLLLYSAC